MTGRQEASLIDPNAPRKVKFTNVTTRRSSEAHAVFFYAVPDSSSSLKIRRRAD